MAVKRGVEKETKYFIIHILIYDFNIHKKKEGRNWKQRVWCVCVFQCSGKNLNEEERVCNTRTQLYKKQKHVYILKIFL